MYASDGGATIDDPRTRNRIPLTGGATYITYNLGDRGDKYEVSTPYANGYYYARLKNLTTNISDRAGVILMAPQASSDDGAPIIDLPTQIRLPIYSTREYKIADILTELSQAHISIDGDITIDTNNNGISDDDFATSGNGFLVSEQIITFGKFAIPGNYTMALRAVDDMGNTTIMPLIVEAYTLVPQIQTITNTGTIIGAINEGVQDTPIHFFRVRSGEIPTILSPVSTLTNISGQFATGSFFKKPETISLKSETDSITVDNHGIFSFPSGYRIDIDPATDKNPMKFFTVNPSGSITHHHILSLPNNVLFIDTSKNTTTQAT